MSFSNPSAFSPHFLTPCLAWVQQEVGPLSNPRLLSGSWHPKVKENLLENRKPRELRKQGAKNPTEASQRGMRMKCRNHTLARLPTGKIDPAEQTGGCASRGGMLSCHPWAPPQCPWFIRVCPASTFSLASNSSTPPFLDHLGSGSLSSWQGASEFSGHKNEIAQSAQLCLLPALLGILQSWASF
jgi:hypothetical protein